MPSTVEERLARLPEWVRAELARRDGTIMALREKLADKQAEEATVETDTYVYRVLDPDLPLDPGATVRFETDGGTVYVLIARGGIEVRARDGQLAFLPSASNTAIVRPIRYGG